MDPADVEDIRLRIEAHQRATEMEAASAKAFRSECERAHGEFLRAISRLDEERRAGGRREEEDVRGFVAGVLVEARPGREKDTSCERGRRRRKRR